jgi:hypothetical protein
MIESIQGKQVNVVSPQSLYKWHNTWGKIQKNYYPYPVLLRREKQIQDFVVLNEFKSIYIERDTDILATLPTVPTPQQADLLIVLDQKFSRRPCVTIIEQINSLLSGCPRLLLGLNRHYINIDNTFCDTELSDHYPLAITQWLKKSLISCQVLDLSLNYLDCGDWFSWVVPDRLYYIEQA